MANVQKLNLRHIHKIASLIGDDVYFKTWTVADLKNFLALETVEGWGMFSHNSLIGSIVFQSVGHESEMIILFVDKNHRRKGLAGHLLQVALSNLRKKNIRNIFLEVSTENKPAISFYKKHSFTIIGRRDKYYVGTVPQDALIMTSLLGI